MDTFLKRFIAQIRRKPGTLQIIPLGGAEKPGGANALLICYFNGEEIKCFLIDCGLSLPNSNVPDKLRGIVKTALPNLEFLKELVKQKNVHLLGILLTHGHLDHIGGLDFLLNLNVPTVATLFTKAILKLRFGSVVEQATIVEVGPGQEFRNWDGIRVGVFEISHSIPGAIGFDIETPEHLIIATGDFTLGASYLGAKTDLDCIKGLIQKAKTNGKQIILLLDSTNSLEPESAVSPDDEKVFQTLKKVFLDNENQRILIITFSSLIARLQMIFDLAEQFNRYVAISGRSMRAMVDLAGRMGYLDTHTRLIGLKHARSMPKQDVVIIFAGTQFEKFSAAKRLVKGEHLISLEPDDCIVLSASEIQTTRIRENINLMIKEGVTDIFTIDDGYRQDDYALHRSGHASQKELQEFLEIFKKSKTFVIPAQTDFRGQLTVFNLAKEVGLGATLLGNNQIFQASGKEMKVLKYPTGGKPLIIPGELIYFDKDGRRVE